MNKLVILLLASLCVASFARHHAPAPALEEEEEQSLALEEQDSDFEEEEEAPVKAKPANVAKVMKDIAKLEPAVKALHKKDVTANLNAIKNDAKQIKSATGQRASNLREAMQDRVQALRLQLEENNESESENDQAANDSEDEVEASAGDEDQEFEEEEEKPKPAKKAAKKAALEESDSEDEVAANDSEDELSNDEGEFEEEEAKPVKKAAKKAVLEESDSEDEVAANDSEDEDENEAALEEEEEEAKREQQVNKIVSDVSAIRAEIKKSVYPKSIRAEALGNLDKIVDDAKRFAKSKDSKISEALNLRMQALEEEMAEKKPAAKKVSAAKVMKDVANVKSHLSEAHLSKKEHKAVIKNLEAIEQDATKLEKAKGAAHERIAKALDLRMHALEEQLA